MTEEQPTNPIELQDLWVRMQSESKAIGEALRTLNKRVSEGLALDQTTVECLENFVEQGIWRPLAFSILLQQHRERAAILLQRVMFAHFTNGSDPDSVPGSYWADVNVIFPLLVESIGNESFVEFVRQLQPHERLRNDPRLIRALSLAVKLPPHQAQQWFDAITG